MSKTTRRPAGENYEIYSSTAFEPIFVLCVAGGSSSRELSIIMPVLSG